MLEDILIELRKNVDAAEAELMKLDLDPHLRLPVGADGSAMEQVGYMSFQAQVESLRTELQFERDTRFQETAALTRMIEEVRTNNEMLKRYNDEILMSTSWKVTAPLRATKNALLLLRRKN